MSLFLRVLRDILSLRLQKCPSGTRQPNLCRCRPASAQHRFARHATTVTRRRVKIVQAQSASTADYSPSPSALHGSQIAKEKIDVYCNGVHAQLYNTERAIKEHFKKLERSHRIIMEATGKYHRLAHRILESMGFQVMVINPYQSKHFAKSLNLLCKTDRVDAKLLALYADRMDFKPTLCASKAEETMQDLSRHLDDLKQLKQELELRARDSQDFVGRSLKSTIDAVEKQIKKTEAELKDIIDKDDSLHKKLALLVSIPGIGETTAICLLSYLKELGVISKREIAALCGLAPVNNDSGTFNGKRRIKGGRHDVRSHLYMPTLGAATQYNKRLNDFYKKLVLNGKPKKVALTACMRKLIVWANAVLASEEPWNENLAENA